jgi:hypothetical protein
LFNNNRQEQNGDSSAKGKSTHQKHNEEATDRFLIGIGPAMGLADRPRWWINDELGQRRKRHVFSASDGCLFNGDHLQARQLLKLECHWSDNEMKEKLNSGIALSLDKYLVLFIINYT